MKNMQLCKGTMPAGGDVLQQKDNAGWRGCAAAKGQCRFVGEDIAQHRLIHEDLIY